MHGPFHLPGVPRPETHYREQIAYYVVHASVSTNSPGSVTIATTSSVVLLAVGHGHK